MKNFEVKSIAADNIQANLIKEGSGKKKLKSRNRRDYCDGWGKRKDDRKYNISANRYNFMDIWIQDHRSGNDFYCRGSQNRRMD
jgi:hypothetical protein